MSTIENTGKNMKRSDPNYNKEWEKENGVNVFCNSTNAGRVRPPFNEKQTAGIIEFDKNIADSNSEYAQREFKTNGSERAESNDKQPIGCNRAWERSWYEVATEFCRMDARIPNRVDRLKSLGNAIVPQIAEIIFNIIKQVENNENFSN